MEGQLAKIVRTATTADVQACAIGRSSKTVREFLEKNYTEDLDRANAIKLTVKSLLEVVQTGAKNIEISVMESYGVIKVSFSIYTRHQLTPSTWKLERLRRLSRRSRVRRKPKQRRNVNESLSLKRDKAQWPWARLVGPLHLVLVLRAQVEREMLKIWVERAVCSRCRSGNEYSCTPCKSLNTDTCRLIIARHPG